MGFWGRFFKKREAGKQTDLSTVKTETDVNGLNLTIEQLCRPLFPNIDHPLEIDENSPIYHVSRKNNDENFDIQNPQYKEELKHLIEKHPNIGPTYFYLSRPFVTKGDHEEARKILIKGFNQADNYKGHLAYFIGSTYLLQRKAQAIGWHMQACLLAASTSFAYANLAMAARTIGRDQLYWRLLNAANVVSTYRNPSHEEAMIESTKSAIHNKIKLNEAFTNFEHGMDPYLPGENDIPKDMSQRETFILLDRNKDEMYLPKARTRLLRREISDINVTKIKNVNEETNNGGTALFEAAQAGYTEVVRALLGHQADMNVQNEYGETPLLLAARGGFAEVVELMLANGADVNVQNKYGETALFEAAQAGHTEVVRALLGHQADANVQERDGKTALSRAARNGFTEVVQLLLANGADVNVEEEGGDTALCQAAFEGHIEVVRALLAHQADVNRGGAGGSSLSQAAYKGHREVVQLLLANGADVNIRTWDDGTALLSAAGGGYTEVVRALLAHQADVNVQSKHDETALRQAAKYGFTEVVQLLLANGADVNMRHDEGRTALLWAAWSGHVEVVQLLLANGANVHLQAKTGQTALSVAENDQIKKLLMGAGAKR